MREEGRRLSASKMDGEIIIVMGKPFTLWVSGGNG